MSIIQSYLELINEQEPENPWEEVEREIRLAREIVEGGARILREHFDRNWAGYIDPDTLEMASCSECVLGQLFGNFHDGIAKLNHSLPEGTDPNLYFDGVQVNFFALNVAYLEYVTGERFEDVAQPEVVA